MLSGVLNRCNVHQRLVRAVPQPGSSAAGRCVAVHAKKEKKGKGPQKKGGSALADLLKKKEQAQQAAADPAAAVGDGLASPEQYQDPDVVFQLFNICTSHWKQYNEFLMETGLDQLADAMYKAPFVCLAHNKFEEGVTDPTFTYANRAALQLFETTWDEIIGLPSRMSADDSAQQDRNQLLESTAASGATQNYEGWRRSLKGKRFRIKGARLFNVADAAGDLWGQAVVFKQYELEDGTLVTVQGEQPPQIELPPSAEDVAAAEAAVTAQAAAVRAMKEDQGLTNKDAAVVEAVEKLKELKEALTHVTTRYEAALHEAVTDTHMSTIEDSAEDEAQDQQRQQPAEPTGTL